jgi:hypothetical protein
MKHLEPIMGKMSPAGDEIVAPLHGVAKHQKIKALADNAPPGGIMLRVRPLEELAKLDIQYEHPRVNGPTGLYLDTSRPPVPSSGAHVTFAPLVEAIKADGEAVIPWKFRYKGRRRQTEESITISLDARPYNVNQAVWLLASYGDLLEEVGQGEEPEQPKAKETPAYAKSKKRAAKE